MKALPGIVVDMDHQEDETIEPEGSEVCLPFLSVSA